MRRFAAWAGGIISYRRMPEVEAAPSSAPLWQLGQARLSAYGKGSGLPVLAVPSLINRAHILDLAPGKSLMRWLADQGFDPYLLDWGEPLAETAESRFTLADYVLQRLVPALEEVRRRTGQAPVVLGYCMGGTLAVALGALCPEKMRGLALMAAPWDFHAGDPAMRARGKLYLDLFRPWLDSGQALSADAIQALFTSLQPLEVLGKFRRFSASGRGQGAQDFVLVEDWLNDGVPLAAGAAINCLQDWYADNLPGKGGWTIGGQVILPEEIELPALILAPSRDRIVPPASALALGQALPEAKVMELEDMGHVGMIISGKAEQLVWRPLAQWLGHLKQAGGGRTLGPDSAGTKKRTIRAKSATPRQHRKRKNRHG